MFAVVSLTHLSINSCSAPHSSGNSANKTCPPNATNKSVSYSSNNTGVATVNASGLVTAVAAGSATITTTTQDGNKTASATITQPADSLNGTTSSTPVSCIGGTDGTASVVATGGTAPYTYAWSSGQNTADITVAPTVTTLYIVTVSNTDGCSVVDSTNVTVIPTPEVDVKIPTAFSPNGDGKNDFFDVLNRFQVQVDEFRIYNRWGELVYNNPDGEWDGRFRNTEQPIGVYVYYLKVTYLKSGKQDALSGNVTLLR